MNLQLTCIPVIGGDEETDRELCQHQLIRLLQSAHQWNIQVAHFSGKCAWKTHTAAPSIITLKGVLKQDAGVLKSRWSFLRPFNFVYPDYIQIQFRGTAAQTAATPVMSHMTFRADVLKAVDKFNLLAVLLAFEAWEFRLGKWHKHNFRAKAHLNQYKPP